MGAGHIPCRAWRDDEQESRSRSFDDCRADVYRVRGDKAALGSVGGHGRISCAGRDSPYNVRRRATGELAIPAGVCGGGDIRLRDGHVDVGFQKRRAHRSVLKMDYAYRGRRDDGGGRGVLFQDVYAASSARTFRCGTVRQIFPENKQGETRFRLVFSGAVRGACSYDIQGREYI